MLILCCFNRKHYCHFYFLVDVVAILNYLAAVFASVSSNFIIGWCSCHVADILTTKYCVSQKWWQMLFPCGRWKGHLLGLSWWCYCPVIDGMVTVGWRLPWGSHVVKRWKLDYWHKISSDHNSSYSHKSCHAVNM